MMTARKDGKTKPGKTGDQGNGFDKFGQSVGGKLPWHAKPDSVTGHYEE